MADVPEVKYTTSGGTSIAYQVWGRGRVDLVIVQGFVSHIELLWTQTAYAEFMERLGRSARVITFDKPGTGLSDPIPSLSTFADRMDDIRAVMDAAGSERAFVFGFSEGGPSGILFAASHPDRCRGLVLYGTLARSTDVPEAVFARLEDAIEHWGDGRGLLVLAPSIVDNAIARRFAGALERAGATPAMAHALVSQLRNIDVTAALGAIRVPTLIVHRRGEIIPVEGARAMAAAIPAARYVELAGIDHVPWFGDSDAVLREIEGFLQGSGTAPPVTRVSERVLSTVLFTDIVGSTEMASRMGDGAWTQVLDRHDDVVRGALSRFQGRRVKSTGDGVLALFAGPTRAVECALEIGTRLRDIGVEVRAGVHTGECEITGEDVAGLAVHVGARIAALAGAGEVLVSSTVKDLALGADLRFEPRGRHGLKGVPGDWPVWAAQPADRAESFPLVSAEDRMTRGDRWLMRSAAVPGVTRAVERLVRRREPAPG